MSLITKRRIKLKWRILLIVISFSIIQSIVCLLIINLNLFFNLKKDKEALFTILINQIALNIDKKYSIVYDSFINMIDNDLKEINNYGFFYILSDKKAMVYSSNYKFNEKYIIDAKNLLSIKTIDDLINNQYKPNKKNSFENQIISERTIINKKLYDVFYYDTSLNKDLQSKLKIIFIYPFNSYYNLINIIEIQLLMIFMILIIVFLLISNKLVKIFSYTITQLDYAVKKIKQGYFDIELSSDSKDEIGNLYNNLTILIKSLSGLMKKIYKANTDLFGYHEIINTDLKLFINNFKKNSAAINSYSPLYNELDKVITKMSAGVKEMKIVIEQAQNKSMNSIPLINDMHMEINKITHSNNEINYITELINAISEKTRLLSLNAAIEASRAGDAGRGFSIVATEIKKLAIQTSNAANQIRNIIKVNESQIVNGIKKTSEIIDILNNINSSTKMLNDINEQINNHISDEMKTSKQMIDLNEGHSKEFNVDHKKISELEKILNLSTDEIKRVKNYIEQEIKQNERKEIITDIQIKDNNEKQTKPSSDSQVKLLELKNEISSNKNKLTKIRSLKLYKTKKNLSSFRN